MERKIHLCYTHTHAHIYIYTSKIQSLWSKCTHWYTHTRHYIFSREKKNVFDVSLSKQWDVRGISNILRWHSCNILTGIRFKDFRIDSVTSTQNADVFRREKAVGKGDRQQKKVKRCRKDVGRGCEKWKRKQCIVKDRKAAVRGAGTAAKTRLMGWMRRHKRAFGGGGGKDADAEWRSMSMYDLLKPHVPAWGEDTTALRTHAKNECRHSHPSGVPRASSQILFLLPTFCARKTFSMSSPLHLSLGANK